MSSSPKQEHIAHLFDQAAERYDITNDAMSLGLHRLWKSIFIRTVPYRTNASWVDVGTGTGDIAIQLWHKHAAYNPTIIACDPNKAMLAIAQKKSINKGALSILWKQACALSLPCESESVDGLLMSFSLRNIVMWKDALREGFRCTKSRGLIRIMEFNPLGSEQYAFFYEYYRKHLVPRLGAFVSKVADPYSYLSQSISSFSSPREVVLSLRNCGWRNVGTHKLLGGAVIIYEGEKP